MCQGLKRLALTCQRVIGQPGQSGSRGPPGHGITGQNCRLCLAEEHHVGAPRREVQETRLLFGVRAQPVVADQHNVW